MLWVPDDLTEWRPNLLVDHPVDEDLTVFQRPRQQFPKSNCLRWAETLRKDGKHMVMSSLEYRAYRSEARDCNVLLRNLEVPEMYRLSNLDVAMILEAAVQEVDEGVMSPKRGRAKCKGAENVVKIEWTVMENLGPYEYYDQNGHPTSQEGLAKTRFDGKKCEQQCAPTEGCYCCDALGCAYLARSEWHDFAYWRPETEVGVKEMPSRYRLLVCFLLVLAILCMK